MRPLVLGLDPSSKRVGWAVADLTTGAPILCGCSLIVDSWSAKATYKSVVDRGIICQRVAGAVDEIAHSVHMVGEVRAIYIELAEWARGRRIGGGVSQVASQVQQASYHRFGVDPVPLDPQGWRQDAGLKATAGKQEIRSLAVALGYRVDLIPAKEGQEDATDAGVIAWVGFLELEKAAASAA